MYDQAFARSSRVLDCGSSMHEVAMPDQDVALLRHEALRFESALFTHTKSGHKNLIGFLEVSVVGLLGSIMQLLGETMAPG